MAGRVAEYRIDDGVDVVNLGGRLDRVIEDEACKVRGQAQIFGMVVVQEDHRNGGAFGGAGVEAVEVTVALHPERQESCVRIDAPELIGSVKRAKWSAICAGV